MYRSTKYVFLSALSIAILWTHVGCMDPTATSIRDSEESQHFDPGPFAKLLEEELETFVPNQCGGPDLEACSYVEFYKFVVADVPGDGTNFQEMLDFAEDVAGSDLGSCTILAKESSSENQALTSLCNAYWGALLEKASGVCDLAQANRDTCAENTPKWIHSENVDAMGRGTTYYAHLVSKNEIMDRYGTSYAGTLMLRRSMRGRLEIYINTGHIVDCGWRGCTILAKFDDRPPLRFFATSSTDHRAVFVSNATSFLKEIQRAKHMLVEIRLYGRGDAIYEFDVFGVPKI